MNLESLAKFMMAGAAVLLVAGAILYALARLGLPRLPGDFVVGGRNWKVAFPLGTSLLLSVLLTVILNLIARWRR